MPSSPLSPFHLGITTPDLEAAMSDFSALLGLNWVALDRPPVCHYTAAGPITPAPRVMYSAQGPLYIELIEAAEGTFYPPAEPTRLHHIGYWADDFTSSLSEAEQDGWSREVWMKDDAGDPATFAYLSRPGDLRIELVDASGRSALEMLLRSALPDARARARAEEHPAHRGTPPARGRRRAR